MITGAGQGIGREYAERFAIEGALVQVVDKEGALADETASTIREKGGLAKAYVADVTDEGEMRRLAADITKRNGRIDVLVNNAALYGGLDADDISIEYLEIVMRANVISVLVASRSVFPVMRSHGRGSIINIGSTGAYEFNPKWVLESDYQQIPSFHYPLSKATVVALSKFMAGAVGKYGIRVNCVCPGLTLSQATLSWATPEVLAEFAASSAMRQNIKPADLFGTVLYLASDDSHLVTGQVIMVDGGYVIPT